MTPEPQAERGLTKVLAFLADERGVDFRDYRPAMIERRLAARLAATGALDVDAYLARLTADPDEADRLIAALVVRVTGFFRDPAVFDALEASVVPGLLASLGAQGTLRAWVAGTATGEEAYSLAMLLGRAVEARPGASFDVIASDIDAAALETARLGCYAREAAEAVPEPLRGRFLEPDPDAPGAAAGVRVVASLRDRIRFARHDLMGPRLAPREAVMADFHVVFCRNVLIYFTRQLQGRAFERFAAALSPGGILVLGGAESVPESARASFAVVDPALRIYRRREGGEA